MRQEELQQPSCDQGEQAETWELQTDRAAALAFLGFLIITENAGCKLLSASTSRNCGLLAASNKHFFRIHSGRN